MHIPVFFLYFLCGMLLMAVIVLCIKLYLIRKSIGEINAGLEEHLAVDTNTLLTVSSRDKRVRVLAAGLNRQLVLLREQRLKYQNGDREQKEAVANISHDLRTPLTAICGYLHLLSTEEKSVEAKRYLGLIENRVAVMVQLTEELFRYSLIRSKPEALCFSSVDIGKVLEESLAAYYAVFTQRGIVPEIVMPKKRVVRELNQNALSRIFENLLGNALKYSDGDFKVTLYEDGRVCFENTAAGLDGVLVGKIFDRFFSVEAAKEAGGLGLSIAKTFTAQMGGQIWAEYQEGKLVVTVVF